MYPLSFQEFLAAFGEEKLIELKNSSSPRKPVTQAVHEKLTTYLRKFFIIGGMPEVVASFVEFSDYSKCQRIINDLLISFNDDFLAFCSNPIRIRHRFEFWSCNAISLSSMSKPKNYASCSSRDSASPKRRAAAASW